MARNIIKGASVVITGASSGIGRAAALEFARLGANLTLCSRNQRSLAQVAADCGSLGGRAQTCVLDVADDGKMAQCARKAVRAFGKLDIWVNDAAVTLYGRLENFPASDIRRVIDTNLVGYLNGCRAAIPVMRGQGAGVIINVSSVAGILGQPYASVYALTKGAVNTLGSCLRMELMDVPRVRVCTLVLPSIDTPMFQHAGNYTGRAIRALGPVYSARRAARVIVGMAIRPRPQVDMSAANLFAAIKRLLPFVSEPVVGMIEERNFRGPRPVPVTDGNLFRPATMEQVSGGWLKK